MKKMRLVKRTSSCSYKIDTELQLHIMLMKYLSILLIVINGTSAITFISLDIKLFAIPILIYTLGCVLYVPAIFISIVARRNLDVLSKIPLYAGLLSFLLFCIALVSCVDNLWLLT